MVGAPVKSPHSLNELSVVASRYKAIACDLWGVLHNGVTAHEKAVHALKSFRNSGGVVVLLSNSPRPSSAVEVQLREMGIPADCYDAMTTSGDLAQRMMNAHFPGKHYFHIGPPRDKPTLDGIVSEKVGDMCDADVVLCTGLFEDEKLSIEQHDDILNQAISQNLNLICANPDRVVDYAERRVYCAGALADRYESKGGKVRWLGKPYAAAYQSVMDQIEKTMSKSIDVSSVLAIGDSLVTDIAGANSFGLDSILISQGLHKNELACELSGDLDREQLRAICGANQAFPSYIMAELSW